MPILKLRQSIFEHNKDMQKEVLALKEQHPDKRVMLIAEKGTMFD